MEDASTAKTIQMESTVRNANFIITGSLQIRHADHATVTPLVQSHFNAMLMDSANASQGYLVKSVMNEDDIQ